MADKINKGNIWTNNVGNNLIVVDPNKIVGSNGGPQDRLVDTEDMVMYANLEARIFPRSKVIAGLTAGDKVSVGIFDGELNFLKPRNSDFLNTDWTEAFTDPAVNQKVVDKDGIKIENGVDFQGFGITSINVILNSSYIPQVTINFTDIRGKTLFEQARGNTPYTAFFHLPYPTFFLTLKGYYGKAVRYQLTMINFTSRFDPTSGDYLVTCIFKGNHIAMLRDIVLHQALTAPYMYPIKQNSDGDVTDTKGRQKLKEVYKIYKSKELIPQTLPELTMVELIEKLKILENDMGRLYGEADLTMTTDKLEYESALNDLRTDILGSKGWVSTYLDKSEGVNIDIDVPDRNITNPGNKTITTRVYPIKGINSYPTGSTSSDVTKFQDEIKEKAENALSDIIRTFRDEVSKNQTFNSSAKDYGIKSYLTMNPLLNTLKNSTVADGIPYGGVVELDVNLTPWIMVSDHEKTIMGSWVKTKELFDGPDGMAKKMAKEVSERLNTKIEGEIGFKPTIRNIFAVLLAGADTFLRLLDDVHKKAMSVSDNEKRKKTSEDSSVDGMVFPWPQYHRVEEEDECTTSSIVTYPGAKGSITETGAIDKEVWPEVEFVEEYAMSSIYKSTKFNLDSSNVIKSYTPTSVKDWGVSTPAFNSVDYVDLLWELISRAQNAIRYGGLFTRFKGVSSNSANVGSVHMELAKYDSENLQGRIDDFEGLKEFFKEVKTKQNVLESLSTSDRDNYVVFEKDGLGRPMTQTTYQWSTLNPVTPVKTQDFETSSKGLMAGKNSSGVFDLVPTIMGYPAVGSNDWVWNNYANGDNLLVGDFYDVSKSLLYDTSNTNIIKDAYNVRYLTNVYNAKHHNGVVIRGISESTSIDSAHYSTCLDNMLITEGVLRVPPTTTPAVGNVPATTTQNQDKVISMLNTPYFINSLITGVNNDIGGIMTEPYKEAAYLFINSLPLPTFREKCLILENDEFEFGNYISQMFNQVGAIHDIPTSLALKIGSLWWRYKSNITTPGSDVLNSIWSDVTPTGIYGSALVTNYKYTTDAGTIVDYKSEFNNTMMVGVYPSLINKIHYIVSGTQPTVPAAGTNLTTGLFASQTNINKSTININDNGVEVQLFTVFVNSIDILTPALQAKKNGTPIGGNYHVLYPSSGALAGTDILSNGPLTMSDVGIHNGATRLIWGLSNYGYFKNKASYKPPTNSYIKKIDTSKEEQFDWELNETEYSTINELRGVFNNEQLEFFETLFLKFSTPEGSKDLGGSMKKLIREFVVVEEEWLNNNHIVGPGIEGSLRAAQLEKFASTIHKFLSRKMVYVHESTTDLEMVKGNSTLLQKIKALINNDLSYDFGTYLDGIDITTITTASPEYKSMVLHVGDYDIVGSGEFTILTGVGGTTNPMYNFFPTMSPNGIACNVSNIEGLAPLIRLYVSYCLKHSVITSESYLKNHIKPLIDEIEMSEANYINNVLTNLTTESADKDDPHLETDMSDSRSKVTSDDLKLELYNQFKVINDRWVSGLSLQNETLFDRFLFFDRANRDIGDKAYINIWDILQIGSPFESNTGASLKQGISSFVSTILANNYFNFIPLPAYINFYNVGNDNTQVQGNTLFGTHRDVDYVESSPAFLCQYVGKPSEQVNVKTTNNGFKDDASNINNPEKNILLGGDCGDREKSSKVVGFNVDFGIENQNIFESVTLDQSQFQNTSESYAILQQMADSGGPGATSMASSSLYNIYNSRSYTAKVTCMGNMMIQPTQYFQLRYLPMFNGPYLIINVTHNISPNNIETSFEGVRVPIPKLPTISDITVRVNEKLFLEAEKRVKNKKISTAYDNNDITPQQSKLTPEDNYYVDLEYSPSTNDGIRFNNPIEPELVDVVEFNSEKPHLGLDLKPKVSQIDEAMSPEGLKIRPILSGRVLNKLNGCEPNQTTNNCGKYGNFIRTQQDINGSTGLTVYYKVIYANLRNGSINVGDDITKNEIFAESEVIGVMGNSGISTGTHLHLEIRRGVKNSSGNVVEHILNPRKILPMFIDNN
jgi:hypothetical protein